MEVQIIKEAGYEEAITGLSLSYNTSFERAERVANNLFDKERGHNKFLESMMVWIDVRAKRLWWQQMDTYRVGVTKQSESTMHTILRRPFRPEDFGGSIYPETLKRLEESRLNKDFDEVINNLPQSYLQRRLVCTSYKVLRHIMAQRRTHKLPDWRYFIERIVAQIQHPEFLHNV